MTTQTDGPEPPAGRQYGITHGDQEAWVTEVGATLRAYRAGRLGLVDGFGPEERSTGGRGQLLLPWPNRIRNGRYDFGGGTHQLPLTEPNNSTAIHGLARWGNWDATSLSEDTVSLHHIIHAQPGYPFVLRVEATYRLGPDGLTVTLAGTNFGASPCPFGAGAHPYLRLDTDTIDELTLTAPASTRAVTDDQSIPIGTEPVDGGGFDFRSPRRIGATELDTAYRDLRRDGDGRCRVRLESPSGATVVLWLGPGFDHLMLFTGDSLGDDSRRRRGLGIEPMTCPPDAFRHEGTYAVLQPQERFEASFGITPG